MYFVALNLAHLNFLRIVVLFLVFPLFGAYAAENPARDSLLLRIKKSPPDSLVFAYAEWAPRMLAYDPVQLPVLANTVRKILKENYREGLALQLDALYLRHLGKADSAVLLHKAGLEYYHQHRAPQRFEAAALNYLSIAYYYLGAYEQHMRYADSALNVYRFVADPGMVQVLQNNRASSLYLLKRYQEAKAVMLGLLSEVDVKNNGLRASICQNLSMTYEALAQQDSAMYWAHQAIDEADHSGELRARQATRQHHIRLTSQTDPRGSLAAMPEMYKLANALGNPYKVAELDLLSAELHLKLEETGAAFPYLQKALYAAQKQGNSQLVLQSGRLLSNYYEKARRYDSALWYQKFAARLSDSLLNADISRQLQELEVVHNLGEKEQQITILKQNAKIEDQRNFMLLSIAISLLVVVVAGGLLLWQRSRDKQRRTTEEKRILTLELSQQKLKEQMLHESLERKNKQLLSEAMHLSERNELLTELLAISDKLPTDRPDAALKVLLDVRKKIKANMNTDQQWEVFSAYFTAINQQFFDKLAGTGITLTDKEKRLLALIKTGLSLKECASILHIEPASIKTSRYRLKQKLGLDDDMNLDDFVKNLPN